MQDYCQVLVILEQLKKNDNRELEEIKEALINHIIDWVDVKSCPVCTDWPDELAKHCTICDGTRKIYIDYSHLYLPK